MTALTLITTKQTPTREETTMSAQINEVQRKVQATMNAADRRGETEMTTAVETRIAVYTFGPAPETEVERGGVIEGFDMDALSGDDYQHPRSLKLYDALGASPTDEEYVLGELPDGRRALVGMTVEGHRFAVEETHAV